MHERGSMSTRTLLAISLGLTAGAAGLFLIHQYFGINWGRVVVLLAAVVVMLRIFRYASSSR